MAKKILILETSVTIRKLFTTTLDSDDYTLQFSADGKSTVYDLFEFQPDLLLINSSIENPKSFEVVRLIRSIKCFKELEIALYSAAPSPLDASFALECGATSFVRLEQKTLVLNVDELAQLSAKKIDKSELLQIKKNLDDGFLFMHSSQVSFESAYKNAILTKLNGLTKQIENIEEMIKSFLLLITEISEVPIACLYIVENDGPHGYYVASENIGEKEITDFLSVCATDFEKILPDYNASKINAKQLESSPELNRFFSKDVQLSSYETEPLHTSDESEYFGSVHIVSDGNISVPSQFFSVSA